MTTALLYRCRRCADVLAIESEQASAELRTLLEAGAVARVHDCPDGAQGVAELIGTGPGRHPFEHHQEQPEDGRPCA